MKWLHFYWKSSSGSSVENGPEKVKMEWEDRTESSSTNPDVKILALTRMVAMETEKEKKSILVNGLKMRQEGAFCNNLQKEKVNLTQNRINANEFL